MDYNKTDFLNLSFLVIWIAAVFGLMFTVDCI